MYSEREANGPVDLCSEREPFGAARAACFEQLAGVFASCGAPHYAKIFASRKKWSYDQNIRLFFDPDSVNHAKSHIFDSFREFQSKNRRVF